MHLLAGLGYLPAAALHLPVGRAGRLGLQWGQLCPARPIPAGSGYPVPLVTYLFIHSVDNLWIKSRQASATVMNGSLAWIYVINIVLLIREPLSGPLANGTHTNTNKRKASLDLDQVLYQRVCRGSKSVELKRARRRTLRTAQVEANIC